MTEIDRLVAWLDEQHINMPMLAREINMSYDGVYQVLYVRKKLSDGFKLRFLTRFGNDVSGEIFEMPTTAIAEPQS